MSFSIFSVHVHGMCTSILSLDYLEGGYYSL